MGIVMTLGTVLILSGAAAMAVLFARDKAIDEARRPVRVTTRR